MYTTYKTGLLQAKAYRIMRGHLAKVLSVYDLSIPEWTILGQVFEQEGIRLAEISGILSVEAPLVTTLTDQLERKQLVNRSDDPLDRRAKLLTLTDQGKNLVPKIEKEASKKILELMNGISDDDKLAYNRVLEFIVKNLSPGD
jgi:MarR family transcriptional regulator for hemolysin